MNEPRQFVDDRRFALELAEALGRETVPDRTAAVLARLANPARGSQAWRTVAALVLVTLVPIAVYAVTRSRKAEADPPAPYVPPTAVVSLDGPDPAPSTPPAAETGAPSARSAVHAAGADPADLAAQRSAERMLEVERTFAQRVRDGSLPSLARPDLTVLPFPVISGWTYSRGLAGMPDAVRDLDGDEVAMLGFMLPVDEVQGMRTFLLVHSLWSCCYGTPPDVNGIVFVQMPAGRTVDYSFEPVAVIGTFRVRERLEEGYVLDVFQLDAESVVLVP